MAGTRSISTIEELLTALGADSILTPGERDLVRSIVEAAGGEATASNAVNRAVSSALGKRISERLGSTLLSTILGSAIQQAVGPANRAQIPPFGPIRGSPGSPTNPGNPPGPPGSPTNPGNPPGPPGSPTNPGNPPGPPGSPTNPGNPPGPPGSPTNPGNPPGPPGSPTSPGNPGQGFILNPFLGDEYIVTADNFLSERELAEFESFAVGQASALESGRRFILPAGSGAESVAEHSFMLSSHTGPLLGRLTDSARALLRGRVPPAEVRIAESARVQAVLVGCAGHDLYRSIDVGIALSRRDLGFLLNVTPRSQRIEPQEIVVARGSHRQKVALRPNTLVLFKGDALAASTPLQSASTKGLALTILGRIFN